MQESTGNNRNWKQYSHRNLLDFFFGWIPVNSLSFPAGIGRKSSEKIRKFSGGNTASTFQRFPVLSCRNQPVFFDLGDYIQLLSSYIYVLVHLVDHVVDIPVVDHIVDIHVVDVRISARYPVSYPRVYT
jgi:hypothetical protein